MHLASLADLQSFAAVARHRSFRKAAAELGVSPSALSHALRGLESRLGIRLLNRTTRSVAPTEAGQQLLARLIPSLREINDALDEINLFRDSPVGTLRINAPRAAAEYLLLPLATRFLLKHPGMRLDIVADDNLVDIVAAGFDAGVRFGERLAQDMIAVPLGPAQRFVVVGSPAYLAEHGTPLTPQQLSAHRCIRIRFPKGSIYRWEFERGSEKLEVEVDGPLDLGEMPLMVRAAEDGLGLAYVYEQAAATALAAGRLQTVLDDWRPPEPGFFLYYPSRRQVPAGLRAFIDFLRMGSLPSAQPAKKS